MESNENTVAVQIKNPKKILHFCDGTMEIFDDEDKQEQLLEADPELIKPEEMTWNSWLKYKASRFGQLVLSGLDYTGEKLADSMGLTSPKYEYEINQYKKQQREREREEKSRIENTWTIFQPDETITKAPTAER